MFKNPFSFKGRIRRLEFGITLIIYFLFFFFMNAYVLTQVEQNPQIGLLGLLFIPAVWFLWAQAAKRSHDIGNAGWMFIIPLYNPFYLLFTGGDSGVNQYGKDPKGSDLDSPDEYKIISTSEKDSNFKL